MKQGSAAGSTPNHNFRETGTGTRPIEVVGTSTAGFVGVAALVLGGLIAAGVWLVTKVRR